MNPLVSEKSYSKESISLINNDGLITKNTDLAKTFNISFSSIIKKLDIEHVPNDESNLRNVEDPILKAIAKYENHPGILRIKNYMKEKDLYFSYGFVDKPKISKEINKVDDKKACQEHDIPVKLMKSKKDLFSHFIYHNFNNFLSSSNCDNSELRTIVQLVFFIRSLRSMKDVCMTKCINTFIKFFLNTTPVFVKVIIHSIVFW